MDRTVIYAVFVFVWWTLSAGSYAALFHEIPEWQTDVRYGRGEVVVNEYDIYISIIPIKGLSPQDSRFAWRKIRYDRQLSLHDRRVFFLGQVVAHNDRYFVSRKINVTRSSSDLSDDRRWMEFTHPGLSYSLPNHAVDDPMMETLVGVDSNTNGIRDDYELDIVFSGLPPDVVDSALTAGKSYGNLLAVANSSQELSETLSTEVLTGLILAKLCKSNMSRVYYGDTWTEAAYFDSIDRVEAKYKLQALLMDNINAEIIDLPDGEPCRLLAEHHQ